MHEIREGLLIASLDDIINKTVQLYSTGVTHVLTVDSKELPVHLQLTLGQHGIRVDYLHVIDKPDFNLFSVLEDALIKLTERKSTDITVVHCFAGMSRSASIIIAYLMKSERMTFDEAFRDVRSKKQDVCPNPGFQEQLRIYEKMGNLVNGDHPLFRKYVMDKFITKTDSYRNKELEFDKDVENLQLLDVKCKKCRTLLLNPTNIRHFASDKCSSIFLTEPEQWMASTVYSSQEGKIYCHNCQSKLGSFKWQGTFCSCSWKVKPSFQILRSKVDVNFPYQVTC